MEANHMGLVASQQGGVTTFEIFGQPRVAVDPGTFYIPCDRVVMAADAYMEDHQKFYAHVPRSSGRYGEFLRIKALRELVVTHDRKAGESISLPKSDGVVDFLVAGIIGEGEFIRVHCPACGADYVEAEIVRRGWEVFVEGSRAKGRDFLCRGGHVLYVSVDVLDSFH